MMTMAKYSDELISVARSLYLRRYTPAEIAHELNLPNRRIIYYWAEKWHWADILSHESVVEAINRRIAVLSERNNKTTLELDELDRLIAHHVKLMAQENKHKEKLAEIKAQTQSSGEYILSGDGEPKKKKRYRKNDISTLTKEDFQKFVDETLFGYQKHLRNNLAKQIRNILKSRQIGATWYFAFEAFENAVLTGDPQIFLSASKPQAEVFRSYIVNIAEHFFGVTLTGNPIRLSNGAELRFLSTNKNTAQSYSGHLYCDEYFWVPDFKRLNEVASAMATHDKWRTTYFSTPSAKTHPAYPFWIGDEWRGNDPKRKNIEFPSFNELRDGGRDCLMVNGATSSRWKMPLRADSTWHPLKNCATAITQTPLTCCICVCLLIVAPPFSNITNWKNAALISISGKTMIPTHYVPSGIAKSGAASTRPVLAILQPLSLLPRP